jgi:hypothetical protein
VLVLSDGASLYVDNNQGILSIDGAKDYVYASSVGSNTFKMSKGSFVLVQGFSGAIYVSTGKCIKW